MAYLERLPLIQYDFTSRMDNAPIVEVIQDLTTKVGMILSDVDRDRMCYRYLIRGTELPEHISTAIYNTPDLAWTILYINRIGNIENEWPLGDEQLLEYTKAKYGADKINNVHHYEKLPEGIWMDEQFIIDQFGSNSLSIVTNLDHETFINEQKRMIYVIKPENISDFTTQFYSLLL